MKVVKQYGVELPEAVNEEKLVAIGNKAAEAIGSVYETANNVAVVAKVGKGKSQKAFALTVSFSKVGEGELIVKGIREANEKEKKQKNNAKNPLKGCVISL